MSPVQNFEQHSRHLVESDLTVQARLQMVMEVRDSLEIAHTAEYLNFLKCYFRAFSGILLQIIKPQFVDNPEHKLRNIVVEILNRLPHSEVRRPFVQDLLKVAMQVLTTDNEENGLICIRIIFDLLRNFRPTLENEVQPFLDFVCKIYQNFKLIVSHFFENMAMTGEDVKPIDNSLSDQGINPATATGSQLNPSTCSFKIVTESPLAVMCLFQLYSHFVQANIPQLLPLMVTAISVPGPERVPPHLRTHFTELKKQGDPIEERYKEHTDRDAVIEQLVYCINSYGEVAEVAMSNDPKFDHIDINEEQKVLNECGEAENWLREKKQQQSLLPKCAAPSSCQLI
ncbi:unnamed protein product [Lathyrus sativus]|nr:unnamed protein product [Lathyrus sativus]